MAQSIKKIGKEFLVNSTFDGKQELPKTAQLTDSKLAIAWRTQATDETTPQIVMCRIFSEEGTPLVNDFPVTEHATLDQYVHDITAIDDNNFVVVWQDLNSSNLTGQVFSNTGQRVSSEFEVSSEPDWLILYPKLVYCPGRGFVVSFTRVGNVEGGPNQGKAEIVYQKYNNDGIPKAAPVFVSDGSGGTAPQALNIALLNENALVIVCSQADEEAENGLSSIIRAKIMSLVTDEKITEFVVNDTVNQGVNEIDIEVSNSSTILVVWQISKQHVPTEISEVLARVFDDTGKAIGNEFQISEFKSDVRRNPRAGALEDGSFIVVWEDQHPIWVVANQSLIKGQRLSSVGLRDGYEFLINTQLENWRGQPAVNTQVGSNFVVFWTDYSKQDEDKSESSIKAQRFSATPIENFLGTFSIFEPVVFPIDESVFSESFLVEDLRGETWPCELPISIGGSHMLFPISNLATNIEDGLYPIRLRHIQRRSQTSHDVDETTYSLVVKQDMSEIEIDKTAAEKQARASNFLQQYGRLRELYTDEEISEFQSALSSVDNLSIFDHLIKTINASISDFLKNSEDIEDLTSEQTTELFAAFSLLAALNVILSNQNSYALDVDDNDPKLTGLPILVAIAMAIGAVIVVSMLWNLVIDPALKRISCKITNGANCSLNERLNEFSSENGIQSAERAIVVDAINRTNFFELEINKYCIVGDYSGRWVEQTPDGTNSGPSRGTGKIDVIGTRVSGTASSGPLRLQGTRSGNSISLSSQFGGRATITINSDGTVSGYYSYSVAQNEDGYPEQGSGTITGKVECIPPEELQCS